MGQKCSFIPFGSMPCGGAFAADGAGGIRFQINQLEK